MKAIKIKMKRNCGNSGDVQDIESIYMDQTGTYWKKSEVYDYLQKFPKTITVNIFPYPYLIPAVSSQGEKYVRSVANSTSEDNLLMLRVSKEERFVGKADMENRTFFRNLPCIKTVILIKYSKNT